MGLAESHIYFNTGVLLYNLEKIRRDIHKAKLRNIISRYVSHLKYPDQDLLNKIFEGKVKYADGRIYNNQFYGKPYEDYIEDACMLHYVYIYKPWKPTLARKNYTYYWNERLAMGDRAGYLLFTLLYRTYHRYKTVNYYCKVFAARVIKMITYKH